MNTNFQYFLNLGWTNFTGGVPRGFGKLKESQYIFLFDCLRWDWWIVEFKYLNVSFAYEFALVEQI